MWVWIMLTVGACALPVSPRWGSDPRALGPDWSGRGLERMPGEELW